MDRKNKKQRFKNRYMKKRISIILTAAAAIVCAGCAKTAETGIYDDDVRYLRAWLKADHPEIVGEIVRNAETGLPDTLGRGVYLLSETAGTGGKKAAKGDYVALSYTVTDMEGTISSYTEKKTAEKLGAYNEANFYGPKIVSIAAGQNYAGVIDAVAGMEVGGERTVFIPKWLMSTQDHESESGYLAASSSASHAIYRIKLTGIIEDIGKHQIDEIEKHLKDNVIGKMQLENGKVVEKVDTTGTKEACRGFYFIPVTDTTGHRTFPSDTTVTINYTGRRLDGQAFDTTIERVAKDNDIWSSSASYGTKSVSWGESFSEIQLGGSSVISGFSRTLWQMNAGKGIGIFWSDLGYGSSGSGNMIPGYAPLIFEIEIVGEEE